MLSLYMEEIKKIDSKDVDITIDGVSIFRDRYPKLYSLLKTERGRKISRALKLYYNKGLLETLEKYMEGKYENLPFKEWEEIFLLLLEPLLAAHPGVDEKKMEEHLVTLEVV